jgi:aquaporin Z
VTRFVARAAQILYVIASGKPDWVPGCFASDGYGNLSPGKYNLSSCFLIETLTIFFFLYVIIDTTSKGAAVDLAGYPLGMPDAYQPLPDSGD